MFSVKLLIGGIIMNTKIKQNINTAGTVGYIVSIIVIVVLIAGMVATALGTVAAGLVAKEDVDVTVTTNFDVTASSNILEKLKGFVTVDGGEDFADLANQLPDGTKITVNDNDISEFSVSETENGFNINAKSSPIEFTAQKLIVALVFSFLYLGSLTAMFYMIKALMKALKECETPFTENVIKRMQNFGWSLIPVIVLSALTESVWGAVGSGSTAINFSLNLGGLLVLAVVFVLTLVFKYGAELQQQSDETL